MAEKTEISWCDSTWNPWIGCTKVSPACDNCYAERDMDMRRKMVQWGAGKPRVRTKPANWKKPLQWDRERFFECPTCSWRGAERDAAMYPHRCPVDGCGELLSPARRRVFCASLADVFDNEVDPTWREDLWLLIARTRNLDWLLLTKRIGNVPKMLPVMDSKQPGYRPWNEPWPWRNVWLGISVINQAEADRDIPKLLAIPARVRFLSVEPMLGPMNLEAVGGTGAVDAGGAAWRNVLTGCGLAPDCSHVAPDQARKVDWVIAGGESGPHARPVQIDWVRSLRDQCVAAGVPLHFKQWGEWLPTGNVERTAEGGSLHTRVGKKAAGRLLDGQQHDAFPQGAPA